MAAVKHRRWSVNDPAIGDRIREARGSAGISQRAAVAPTPYTAAYLSRIESGDRTPSVAFLRAIAPQLDVSVAFLETGEDLVDVRVTRAVAERLGLA